MTGGGEGGDAATEHTHTHPANNLVTWHTTNASTLELRLDLGFAMVTHSKKSWNWAYSSVVSLPLSNGG